MKMTVEDFLNHAADIAILDHLRESIYQRKRYDSERVNQRINYIVQKLSTDKTFFSPYGVTDCSGITIWEENKK